MGNVLDQNEVDALLTGVVKGEIETGTDLPPGEEDVVSYDMTNQDKIRRGRMPTLEIINERFSRLFRVSLSSVLRKTADVSIASTDMIKFGEFTKSLPLPTSLNIFRMEPLRGHAMIVVESKLLFAIIDTLFGGTGKRDVKIEGRNFSPIEQNIIKKLVYLLLEDLQKAWKPVQDVDLQYTRTEVNPQFAAIVPPSEVVILITVDIELEHDSGAIKICIPYSTIEPIKSKLHAGFQSDKLEVDKEWAKRLREQLNDACVNLSVEMGKTEITARDLLKLKEGDVIQLDNAVDRGVVVNVEGVEKYKGTPGVHNGNNGVKIREILR